MSLLKNFAYLTVILGITHVFANSIRFYDAQDPFVPNSYDPVQTLLPTDQKAQVYAGVSFIHYPMGTKNQNLVVVPSGYYAETDSLSQTGSSGRLGFTAAIEAVRLYENSVKTTMRGFAYGLMVHVAPQKWAGNVYSYQIQNSANNNYKYSYDATPVDFAAVLELYPMRFYAIHTMPFVILGGGISVDTLNFQQTPTATGVSNGATPLSVKGHIATTLGLIGGGLQLDVTNNWFVKTEYLYHYRGTTHLNMSNSFGSEPVPVNLNESSVDVMMGYRF